METPVKVYRRIPTFVPEDAVLSAVFLAIVETSELRTLHRMTALLHGIKMQRYNQDKLNYESK